MKSKGVGVAAMAVTAAALAVAPVFAHPAAKHVPCPSGASRKPVLGKGSAQSGTVLVNGAAKRKSKLFSGNVACTGAGGFAFKIYVAHRHASCTQDPASSVVIHPRASLLHFVFGHFLCETHGSKMKRFYGGEWAEIIARDPIFDVSIGGKKVVIRVATGSLLVSGASGPAHAVVVGPGQATHVSGKTDPVEPTEIKLTDRERAAVAKLGSQEPHPNYGAPDPKGSAALTRILANHSIAVGFDAKSADSGAPVFLRSYFDFLTTSWNVKWPGPQFVGSATALAEVAKGKLDVAVVPETHAFGFDAVPLFSDSTGKTWSMYIAHDSVFAAALRRFLVSAVNAGKYYTLYLDAFHVAPSYDALRPVLFPK
jgi:hypothetical protein